MKPEHGLPEVAELRGRRPNCHSREKPRMLGHRSWPNSGAEGRSVIVEVKCASKATHLQGCVSFDQVEKVNRWRNPKCRIVGLR